MRFPLSPDLRSSWVKVAGTFVRAEILEQSAGGFRVRVLRGLQVAINDVLQLETQGGTCDAIVAYVESDQKFVYLGLERSSDMFLAKCPLWQTMRRGRWTPLEAEAGPAQSWTLPAVLVGAGVSVAMLILGWCAMACSSRSGTGATVADVTPDRISTASDLASAPRVNAAEDAGVEPSEDAAMPSDEQKPPRRTHSGGMDQETLAALQRMATLQMPRRIAELQFSERQKLEIKRLLQGTTGTLASLHAARNLKAAVRDAKIKSVVGKAEAKVMELLTPQQRVKYRESNPDQAAESSVATSSP
jgi:hypothetical protein